LKILQRTIRRKRGKHCARIRFEDNNGKIHEIMRTADNKSAAKTRLAQLEAEILEKGTARFEAGKVTFRQLAEYVKTRFYVPATYSEDGSKISGVRSVQAAHSSIKKLVEYFGDKDITKIDDEALEKYKARRQSVIASLF
jgi:plasmid replication initiation protein